MEEHHSSPARRERRRLGPAELRRVENPPLTDSREATPVAVTGTWMVIGPGVPSVVKLIAPPQPPDPPSPAIFPFAPAPTAIDS